MGTALPIQCFLFGAACMNAFWHPSTITVGLLPAFAVVVLLTFRRARGEQ